MFNMNGVNLNYETMVDEKLTAIKACLRNWGLTLRRALKEQSGLNSQDALYRAIGFRVEVTSKRDLTTKVRLLVGILDPASPVLKYLKFVLYGTNPHFAPVVYHGRYTGILGWAQKRHLVYKKGRRWYWAAGKLKDEPFVGIPNQHNRGNDFFTRVYNQYNSEIKRELKMILGGNDLG